MMNNVLKNTLFFLVGGSVAITMTGCGPKVKLAEFKKAPIENCDIMPTKSEMAHVKPKVVVMPLANGSSDIIKKVDAGNTIANTTETLLSSSKLVELVDRSAAEKLRNELSIIELKGDSGKAYQGPNIADMAISGSLNSASVTAKFTEASTVCNKEGKCWTTPASCSYSGSISGTLKVYELPNLKVSDSFPISGEKSFSEEGGCKSNYDKEGLISAAAVKAPDSARVELLNLFSPKGYITERRENDGKSIFLCQIGSIDGAAYNLKIKIYSLRKNSNPLTGVTTSEEVMIGEGVISDQVTPNTAWVLIEDKEISNQIKLGDFVKFNFKKGLLDAFM